VRNIGWVKTPSSFEIEMYAFDSVGEYRIAKQTSGITFPDPSFVAGTFT
jgi:hypothetical protein